MQHNFLIVGFGSMGKRRARLLSALLPSATIAVTDSSEERRAQATELGFTAYVSIDEATTNEKFTAALICAAPLAHFDICKKLFECDLHVFCELNLNEDGYDELEELSRQKNLLWFNSNTMLYRGETREILRRRAEHKGGVSYTYRIGQYLPDWHPWESYKNFFVGDSRTSGVREILAIELAWLTEVFGEVTDFVVKKTTTSMLEVSYEDTIFLIMTHSDGTTGSLAVDIVSPKPVRLFCLTGEGIYLTWDGTPDSVRYYDTESRELCSVAVYDNAQQLPGYSDNIVENAYTAELENFLSALEGKETPKYDLAHNRAVLRLIEKIEK